MTGPPPPSPSRLRWQTGVVTHIREETYRAKTFTVELPDLTAFRAGQHYDVRLTAPDGYQAQRSYSIASAPETRGAIDLTIEEIPDGEVSPYFHHVVEQGDRIELRGPIGGPFHLGGGRRRASAAGGRGIGSGPADVNHPAQASSSPGYQDGPALLGPVNEGRHLPGSAGRRCRGRSQFAGDADADPAATGGWEGHSRRIDRGMLEEALGMLEEPPLSYVCGPTPFVEAVADGLVEAGAPPERVRTERFGPSGG